MDRLTSNKSVSEMSMYELAHNSCYAKDGNARYMDYDTDIDARELAIKILDKYADIPNEFTCDEDFDDFMLDSLQYGTDDSVLGLIAVFYRNLWAMADLRERLKEYEELEEQGKLLRLPCAVGDIMYVIEKGGLVSERKVYDVQYRGEKYEKDQRFFMNIGALAYFEMDFGKTVFLTREQAEAALKELEGRSNDRERI